MQRAENYQDSLEKEEQSWKPSTNRYKLRQCGMAARINK